MELEHVLIILLIVVVVYALSPDIERDTIKLVTGKHAGIDSDVKNLRSCEGKFTGLGCPENPQHDRSDNVIMYYAWADGISTNNKKNKHHNVFVQCPKVPDGDPHLCKKNNTR